MLDINYQFHPRQLRALLLLLILLPFVPAVIAFRFMFESLESERIQINNETVALYESHLRLVTTAASEQLRNRLQPLMEAENEAAFRTACEALAVVAVFPTVSKEPRSSAIPAEAWEAASELVDRGPGWHTLDHDRSLFGVVIRPPFTPEPVVLVERADALRKQLAGGVKRGFGGESEIAILLPGDPEPTGNGSVRLVAPAGDWLPGWRTAVDFEPSLWQSEFQQQARFYLWAAVVLGAVILGISILAAYEVLKQLRLQSRRLTTLAVLAHELRTPIAASRVLLETLGNRRAPDPTVLAEYLGLLREENERLARTVQNLLSFARFEMGGVQLRAASIEPKALLEEAARPWHSWLEQPDTDWRVEVAPDCPPMHGDRTLLLLAIGNLVDNAMKYSSPPRKIRLSAQRAAGGGTVVEVADNGCGISAQAKKTIFAPFQQGSNSLSRSSEGCGLGLGIVRHVMKAHGGRVELDSAEGVGSRFRLYFPKT